MNEDRFMTKSEMIWRCANTGVSNKPKKPYTLSVTKAWCICGRIVYHYNER